MKKMKSSGWENTDAVNFVECPKCKQPAGKDCRSPKGQKYYNVHWQRLVELKKHWKHLRKMQNKKTEKQVLSLLRKHPLTFGQVGDVLGVSRQYIHQIYKRAKAEGKEAKRYEIVTIKHHRVYLCKTCQSLAKILKKYDVISRDALGKKLGISRKNIPFHLQRVREAGLVPNVLFFNSDRMARVFVEYKKTYDPVNAIGVRYGYKNLWVSINRMGKKGVDISRHPDQNIRALLTNGDVLERRGIWIKK